MSTDPPYRCGEETLQAIREFHSGPLAAAIHEAHMLDLRDTLDVLVAESMRMKRRIAATQQKHDGITPAELRTRLLETTDREQEGIHQVRVEE